MVFEERAYYWGICLKLNNYCVYAKLTIKAKINLIHLIYILGVFLKCDLILCGFVFHIHRENLVTEIYAVISVNQAFCI